MKLNCSWGVSRLFIPFLFLTLFLFCVGCQKDDTHTENLEIVNQNNKSSTKIVNASDIPEVMHFVYQHTNDDLSFTVINSTFAKSTEPDLTIGTILTDNIIEITNDFDKSNYTFKVAKDSTDTEVSVLNFIVKETSWGMYGYIIKFRTTIEWILSNPKFHLDSFTGDIIIYNLGGKYIAKHTYLDGLITNKDLVDPCPPDGDGSPDTGGGGTDGSGGTGGDSGSDGSGDSGTGGSNIDISIVCGCPPRHPGGNSNPSCNCTLADIITIVFNKTANAKDLLRNPCPDLDCTIDCEYGISADCTCLPDPNDPVNENPDTGMNISLLTVLGINSLIEPDLTYEQVEWLNDNIPFAEEALIALQNGGEVNFDEHIILEASFTNHVRFKNIYDKYNEGTNTITQYLQNFEGDFSVAHLRLSTDDDFSINHPDFINAGAVTLPPQNYLIDIIFNTDISLPSSDHNFPKIILAVEFLHEIIHAEMFRKMLSVASNPNVNFSGYSESEWVDFMVNLRNDFPGIWDYYLRFEVSSPNPSDSHHQLMAQHYITIMAQALSDYDDDMHSQEFYEALSWLGLKNTRAWDLLTNDEQNNINDIINTAINDEPFD